MDAAAGAPFSPAAQPLTTGIPSNLAAALCYLLWFITGVVFLVLEPYDRDPHVRFHAFQSIFFTITAIVLTTIVGIVPWFGPLVWLGLMAIWVVLMVRAYSGKKWKLPVIGDWAERQAEK